MKLYASIYLFGSLALLAACNSGLEQGPELAAQAVTQTLSIPLSNGKDDVEEGSRMVMSGKALDFSQNRQTVALRFTNVKVPRGAKIKAATISFTAITNDAASLRLQVRAENGDNAAPFGKSVKTRTKTAAVANWNPGRWQRNRAVSSVDLSRVVQEVVSRGGWKPGNALAFYVTGNRNAKRSAYSRDMDSKRTPLLKITFEQSLRPSDNPEPVPNTPDEPSAPSRPNVPSSSCLSSGVTHKLSGNYQSRVLIRNGRNVAIDARDARFLAQSSFLTNYNSGSFCLSGGFVHNGLSDAQDWDTFHSSSALVFYNTPNAVIENMTVEMTGDGITFKNNNPNWLFRDSYIRHAGDDGVENDRFNDGTVDDVLIDWAYTGLSCRKEQLGEQDVPYNFTVKNTLIALKPQKGTYKGTSTTPPGHNQLFKVTQGVTRGCQLVLRDNVFLISQYAGKIDPSEDLKVKYDVLNRSACQGHKNTIVYTGGESWYLKELRAAAPECFDVTTDIGVWKAARARWFDRHPQFAQYKNSEPRGAR